jgi:autotransporter adhesin
MKAKLKLKFRLLAIAAACGALSSPGFAQVVCTNAVTGTAAGTATNPLDQACGAGATATGTTTSGAMAIGYQATATGSEAQAIGLKAFANGDSTLAVGSGARATGIQGATAVGRGAVASGSSASALGYQANAIGDATVAVGNASATGVGAVAVGQVAVARAQNATALGIQTRANNAGDVALGGYSTTAAAVSTAGITINGDSFIFGGGAAASTVSVGSAGQERTITNVAAGRITSLSTDAVNGSQLAATNAALITLSSNVIQYDDASRTVVTLGGAGGTTLTNVRPGNIAVGSTDAVNGGQLNTTNQNVATNTAAITNLSTSIASGTVGLVQQVGGAPGSGAITVGSTTGGTVVDFTGTEGTRVLSGVSTGVAGTDAVNVDQLNAGMASTLASANSYTDSKITGAIIGATTAANTYTDGKTRYFQANSTGVAASATGTDAVAIGPGAATTGNAAIAGGLNATASGDGAVVFGSAASGSATNAVAVGAGSQATHANSVALGAGSTTGRGAQTYVDPITGAARSSVGEVSIGGAGAERQLTNVADGSADTDGVNLRQLTSSASATLANANSYTDGKAVSTLNQANSYTDSTAATTLNQANSYTDGRVGSAISVNNSANLANPVASGSNSVAIGPGSVADRANTVSFGTPGAERQLTNVAPATADTDATNLGQVRSMVGNSNAAANQYTDRQIQALDAKTQKQMSGVGAMAMAVSALQPNARAEGNMSVSAAAGAYGGEGAIAAGVNYYVSNQVLVNARIGLTSSGPSKVGAAVGVTVGF